MDGEVDFIEVIASALPATLCAELVDCLDTHPGVRDGVTGAGLEPAKKRSRDLTLDAHSELHALLRKLQPYTLMHLSAYFRRCPFALIGGITPTVLDPKTGQSKLVDIEAFSDLEDAQLFTLIKTLFRSGTVNVQKYAAGVGGYPHWHSEIYPRDERCEPLHRVLFYMYYLNTVEQGGETEFYFQGRAVAPKQGTMVIAPAGFTHTHRGNTPLSGDKYIATSWLLFRRAEELYRPRPTG